MFDIPERLRTVRNPHSFRMVLDFLGYHGYFWGPDWAEKTYRDFRYWDHFFQVFGKSVFTWLHGGHISVPKQWNGRHIGFQTNPVGAELFSFVKKVLLFPSICTDAGHATALFDGSRTCKYLIFCQGLRDNSDRVTRTVWTVANDLSGNLRSKRLGQ